MEIFKSKNGVSFRAYQGDAITLLAFDVKDDLAENLAGFTIFYQCKQSNDKGQFLYNRLTFDQDFLELNAVPFKDKNSTLLFSGSKI